TLFVTQDAAGRFSFTRRRPALAGQARLGPWFVLDSTEPGMAGLCALQVYAQVPEKRRLAPRNDAVAPLEYGVLISDGPRPVAPGRFPAAELAGIDGFALRLGKRVLGVVPLAATPLAKFDTEGGFQAADTFLWNDVAEQELQERLNRLVQ